MSLQFECPYCFKRLKNEMGLKMHLVKNIDCLPIESYVAELTIEKRNELATNKVKNIQRNLGELKNRINWLDQVPWVDENSFISILKQVRDVLKLINLKEK